MARRALAQRYRTAPRRSAFTLVEIMVVMAILAILSTILMSVFQRSRTAAQRAQCDVRLKSIALALDAHRQENGTFPADLNALATKNYLSDPDALHCPADLNPEGSYREFYVLRAKRDSNELPILVCPFHEGSGQGAQAYIGKYTTQFASKPARLGAANNVSVQHPGGGAPVAATTGMELHGGDRIITGPQGAATIEFADGSTASLRGGSNVTLLQSFVEGHAQPLLYTLVRQTLGDVTYQVHHGSKFDVVTPTATAGALGTKFQIKVDAAQKSTIWVTEGKVRVSDQFTSALATPQNTANGYLIVPGALNLTLPLLPGGLLNGAGGGLGGLLGGLGL